MVMGSKWFPKASQRPQAPKAALCRGRSRKKMAWNLAPGTLECGATFLETSIAAFFLLLLGLVAVDCWRICKALEAGQYSVSEAARWTAFGNVDQSSNRRVSAMNRVVTHARALGLNAKLSQVRVCTAVKPDCSVPSSLQPRELFSVRLDYPFTFVTFPMTTVLRFEVVEQNEPY